MVGVPGRSILLGLPRYQENLSHIHHHHARRSELWWQRTIVLWTLPECASVRHEPEHEPLRVQRCPAALRRRDGGRHVRGNVSCRGGMPTLHPNPAGRLPGLSALRLHPRAV